MGSYQLRLAVAQDRPAIIDFMNTHWGGRHPLVNLPDYFDYYYLKEDGSLRFALAEEDGRIVALAGYVAANQRPQPDLWVSLWVADKAAPGSGLELMEGLPRLTGCRTLACNNIRPETRPFYEFLGYTTGRVGHFYRLAPRQQYRVAQVASPVTLPVSGNALLTKLPDEQALISCGFVPPENRKPYKDLWYVARRYYRFPRQSYDVYAAAFPGDATPQALLVTRAVPVEGATVLRLVDYIGSADFFPQLGNAIDKLMQETNAEYADLYCVGLPDALLAQTGFTERAEGSQDTIPNYLTPILRENTEFYYFTSQPEGFTLFKADGDQDRPNISMESP